MSGYPYDQGQWPPSQPAFPPPQDAPLPSHDYSHQNSILFPVMYGGFPYQTTPQAPQSATPQFPASTAYYTASQATRVAFEHNANAYVASEPSAAAHGPATTHTQSPVPGPRSPGAVGGDLSWSQAFPTRQTATPSAYASYSQPPAQQFSSGRAVYQNQDQQQHLYSSQQQPPSVPQRIVYSPPAYLTSGLGAPPASQNAQAAESGSKTSDLEEGELNEEDMDDDYDPEDNVSGSAVIGHTSMSRDEPSGTSKQQSLELPGAALEQAAAQLGSPPSRDASVIDTQEDEFYDEEEDEPGEVKSTGKSASPSDAADADDEDMGFSDSSEHGSTPARKQENTENTETAGKAQAHGSDAIATAGNGHAVASASDNNNGSASTNGLASTDPLVLTDTSDVDSSRRHPFTTLEQGKKEAQRAILRLIPYGVNFQTYIDEGFDEKVIKPLFAELGLKTTPTNSAAQPEPSKPPSPQLSAANVAPTAPGIVDPESGPKKEERKDRIARLLALKNTSKASPAPTPPAANTPSQPTSLAPQQAHSEKTKSEKEKLLQQKLGKLRRTQELRAAAAAKARAQATAMGKAIENEQDANVPDHPVAATQTVAARIAPVGQKPAATGPQLDRAIPATGTGGRKRPVAADFADFTSTPANPLKRPFSMTRQDSSLVIDISDDSDNDVEMELESQTDETPVKTFADSRPARGGPSFRDRPPLPETSRPSRPQGHSSSFMRTPPSGPARSLSRTKDDEYAKKLRQIEEMKRKIARAEAMKARSTPTGSLTPKTAVSSPPDSGDAVRREAQGVRSGSHAAGGADGAEHGTAEEGAQTQEKRQPRAFEASDAVSSRSSSRASHHEQRARIASQQLPRVEASLQEKMFKLKLFQEKIAALEAEINAGMAEKQRLKEAMDALAGESEGEETHAQTESMPPQQPTTQVEDGAQVQADTQAEAAVHVDAGAPVEADMQAEMQVEAAVDQSRPEPPAANVPDCAEPMPAAEAPTCSDNGNNASMPIAETSAVSGAEPEARANDSGGDQSQAGAKLDARSEPGSDGDSDSNAESVSESTHMSDASSPKEPTPDILDGDGDVIMEDDAEPDEDVVEQQEHPSAALLEPPSAAAAHERTTGPQAAAHRSTAAAPSSATFVPYESPLQNFNSFRFHPKYKDLVKGGLKSLTFSGRIRDDVVLCPYELEDRVCPDPACGFQHFASMAPKDDQLLVELGRSDDFSGEQKAQFVNGLKDLLKRVRDAKVRDFDTIADEIIRFRRAFLGDDSKVVSHLGDVTI